MGTTTSTEQQETESNKISSTPSKCSGGSGSTPATPIAEENAPKKVEPPQEINEELWTVIQSQISSLQSDQQFWEKQITHDIETTFPTVTESGDAKLRDRCKDLFKLTKDKFFKEANKMDFVSTIEATTFPSEEFLEKLDPGQKALVESFCSPKIMEKFVKKTLHKALESKDPLKYLADQVKWDEIQKNFVDTFSWSDSSSTATDSVNIYGQYDTSGLTGYTNNMNYDPNQMNYGASNFIDPTNAYYDTSGHYSGQTWETMANHVDTLSSTMSNWDYFNDYMDSAVPIPVITMGIDLFKEVKLLAKGKTDVGTASGHIVGHALVVIMGSSVGGALGTLFAPGIGTIIGSAIGCKLANVIYNDVKTQPLKDNLESFNEYSKKTNEELTTLLSKTESEMKTLVTEEVKNIKTLVEERKPLDLSRVLMRDAKIRELLPKNTPSDVDLVSLLGTQEFRDQIAVEQKQSKELMKRILQVLDQHKASAKLWAQSIQMEVWSSQKKIGEAFKSKLQAIDDKIKTFNTTSERMKKKAQELADKLGIELSFSG